MISSYHLRKQKRATMAISFKGTHFPQNIILMGVRWYLAYPLSYRHVEELMEERGVPVDHATIQRWVVEYSPLLEEAFHRRKRPVWVSWRMDETYIKVKGQWYYLYRAVDKYGQTIDFLLTEHRDTEAALRFLKKAIRRNGLPEMITIDGSDANEAAIKRYNQEYGTAIAIRQVKYLNNIVDSWLRVFLSAGASRIGHRRRQQQHTRVAGVRKMRRTPAHSLAQNGGDRRVFWLRYACCTVRAWSSFLPLLQEVDATCKTRNQLSDNQLLDIAMVQPKIRQR